MVKFAKQYLTSTRRHAVSLILEAMLQSPRFLYRIEQQSGDGSSWPVEAYELASRMSYIVWGGPPDRELMRAADANELHDPVELGKQLVAEGKDHPQVATILCDTGFRYLSTLYNAEWLASKNLPVFDWLASSSSD